MTNKNEQYMVQSLIYVGQKKEEDDHLFENLSTSWI